MAPNLRNAPHRARYPNFKHFKEPKNRFPAWWNGFLDSLNVYKYRLISNAIQNYYFLFIQHRAANNFATLSMKVGKSNEKIQKKQHRKFCETATRKYYETESNRL